MVATAGVVAACFLGAGAVGLRLRGHRRIGLLLAVIGLLWTVTMVLPAGPLRVTVIGAWAAVLAHLVVAFPTGHLGDPMPRMVVGLAYAGAATVGWVALGADAGELSAASTAAVAAGGLAVIGLQLVRWRRSTAARRHLESPFAVAAIVAVVAFATLKPALIAGVSLQPLVEVALALVPLAYLASLLRRRIDRAGIADLVVRLTDGAEPVERALARALHDPSLTVSYRGDEVEPATSGRVATRIERDGEALALIVHDPALLADRELIEATCAAAGLALANERLTAELKAEVRLTAELKTGVRRAAEQERRRFERDLHDGLQQRLLAIPMILGRAETVVRAQPERAESLIGEAKATTLDVLAELRALSQGIHPPVLTERGLEGALRELAVLSPVPLDLAVDLPERVPAELESVAYYVVAEGLANIAKHAGARQAQARVTLRGGQLTVEVDDDGRGGADPAEGSGLRGLAGRVAACGGVFKVDSVPAAGTRIRAVLPCG